MEDEKRRRGDVAIINILILLVVVFGLVYIRANKFVWIPVVGLTLLLFSFFGSLGFFILTLSWLIFIAATAFVVLKKQRQQYFTQPLVQALKKHMPAISQTEQEAIEAGDVWWEKELFCGRPDWQKLLSIPKPTLSKDEQDFLDNQVETVCSMINDWDIVQRDRDLPKAVWDYLKKEKFFGMVIPREYGGRGFSALAHSTVVVKIATRSISAAVNTMVPNSLGPGELILHYGTPQQKEYYLPRLARGEEIPCFALTGPEAGSDAGSITDTGIVCHGKYDGKEVLGIRLTWDKRYITLAPVATVLGIAFRLYDPEHLISPQEDIGITLCLVPTSHPGVEIGNRHLPMSMAFMNGPTRGKDVFIPIDWIIGGIAMAGQGWRMLMECLSVGRAISLPALSTANGKLIYRMTGAYARIRKQFNTAIANFEGIEEALGNIAGLAYTLEACRIMTAGAVDQKISPAIASAIAKYHMTEMSRKVITHSMDIHAGHGIQMGPRNYLAYIHCAIPISITVEGANILTRNLIIFGQGAIRCHPYILREVQLMADQNVEELDSILLSHIGYAMSNVVRAFWSGLTGGIFLSAPVQGATARYYKQLTRMSSALALLADVSMLVLGGTLKRRERISARLGDILSQLYIASSVLKYYQDQRAPASDLDYVRWSVETCLYHIQEACNDVLNNFPIPWLGKVLHWIIFPLGDSYRKPSDKLYHSIVKSMLEPSELRDRITKYFYAGEEKGLGKQMDATLSQVVQTEPIWKKFQNAVRNGKVSRQRNLADSLKAAVKAGALTEDEAHALRDCDALQKEIIKVDEFSFDLTKVVS